MSYKSYAKFVSLSDSRLDMSCILYNEILPTLRVTAVQVREGGLDDGGGKGEG